MKPKLKLIKRTKKRDMSEISREKVERKVEAVFFWLTEMLMLDTSIKTISKTNYEFEFRDKW